ncbi:MAG: hypothetical protein MPN21_14630 [Thermoanaerobaculia bacterium]|nr:hypothetical protein [Thermoanaerobaculia bacterium]
MIIAHQNIHFLRQAMDLVERIGSSYAEPGPYGQASAGAHMRHVLDCYHCFLRGLGDEYQVNYDARDRDRRIETDGEYASAVILRIVDSLESLRPEDLEHKLKVQVDAAAWKQSDELWSDSSVGRELQFLLSHTVHHFALMAMILRALGTDPGEEFGVAPSTLEHRRTAPAGT